MRQQQQQSSIRHLRFVAISFFLAAFAAACARPGAIFSKTSEWFTRCGFFNGEAFTPDKGAAVLLTGPHASVVTGPQTDYSTVFSKASSAQLDYQYLLQRRLYITNVTTHLRTHWAGRLPDPRHSPFSYLVRPGTINPYEILNNRLGIVSMFDFGLVESLRQGWEGKKYWIGLLSNGGYKLRSKKTSESQWDTLFEEENRGPVAKLECKPMSEPYFLGVEDRRQFWNEWAHTQRTNEYYNNMVFGVEGAITPQDWTNYCGKTYTLNGGSGHMSFDDLGQSNWWGADRVDFLFFRPKEFILPCTS